MAKQLNVNLAFSADTSKAKNAIQSLINDLNTLSSTSGLNKDLPITKEIMEAQAAAKQLGDILHSSFNVDSGKLDLSKFTQQLKASDMSLSQYGNKLSLLGTQGDQAFLKIAQSIAKTQTPLRQSNKLLTEFATTLKNTARWQISSSILHGFMGAVQSAYGYAQNLDKSLNNIRIVTGQNAEQMAVFAEQANKAAKALSTTTTEYTNASLIYYQQGLNDEEVAKRTEITVKMANAAGQSAEIVSDQLTAVWNNFYDGSKSLEYYADVMTALGAATASSTDEIAGGLEKFAAIGETIGLSYEYAASALATITSNTRQSEEVVGTALKTIFARIQGLNLGETLDDGTTLNKYSKALESVGISIFDSAGELKKMDIILDEMAAKWDTLSKAQQAALAQTIAGTRQYTQLVALMNNWDNGDSDSMTANLETSYGATGTLQEQADIYEESWKASKGRVTASLESIYNSLIDEEFFINLNDTFSKLLNGISSIIDAMGGLKGIIGLAGIMLVKYFGTDLSQGINNALANFRIFTGAAQEDMATLKKEAYDSAMAMTEGLSDSPAIQGLRASLENTYKLQNDLTAAVKRMSPEQRAVAEEALKTAEHYNDIAVEAGRAAEKTEELYINSLKASQATRDNAMNTMQQNYDNSVGQSGSELLASARGMKSSASDLGIDTSALDAAIKKYSNALHDENMDQNSEAFKKIAATLRTELDSIAAKAEETSSRFKSFESSLRDSAQEVVSNQSKFEELKLTLVSSGDSGEEFANGVEEAAEAAKAAGGNVEVLEKKLANYRKLLKEGKAGTDEFKTAERDLRRELDITHVSTEQATSQIVKLANTTEDGRTKVKVLTDEQIKQADAARQSVIANNGAGEAIRVAGEKSAEATAKIKYTKLAYQSIGTALAGTLGAISSFAMGLNSLKSIYDTLNNTELSTFEKTTQIMMSLSMAIPALRSGLKGVGNAFHFVFSAQKKGLTGQIAYLLGAKQEIATDKLLVIGKNGEVLARGAAGDAAVIEALKTEGATTVTKLDTAATWANIAAKMVKYLWIGLIIVAIGILIGVVYNLVKAYNAEAEAAQKAAEKAEQVKKVYEETKQAAEDLKSTIDKYKNAKDAMSGLKKGTVEYKEALLEANEQALELLKTYEGLSKYATRNSEGLIIISDEGLEEILDQQYQDLAEMQTLQTESELKASKAQEKSDILNFARSQKVDYDSMNSMLNAIMEYFENNNTTDLIPSDIDKLTSLTEEQRKAISTNIDGYSKMANSLISTNDAQEVLTQAYLDAAWRLNNPDVEPDDSGRYAPEDVMATSLFNTYTNRYYLSDKEQEAAKSKYIDEKWNEFIGEDGFGWDEAFLLSGNMPNLNWGLTDYSSQNGYWSPSHMNMSDAQFYAQYHGYDEDIGSGFDWAHLGMGYYGSNTWTFKKNGTEIETLDGGQLAQGIADIKTTIENNEKAKIEAPEILANVDQVLAGLTNNKNLANLMYSAQMDENGKGQFTMPDYYMSQEEAQTWLNNWGNITSQFEGKMTDTGFWQKMGFERGDAFLSSLNTWLTNRSQTNDADAFKNGGVSVANMKTASENVSAKVKNGDLTSANADDDVSYQNMVMYAKDLLQIYPELTEAANTFTNAGLIGTQEWINAYDIIAGKINTLDAMAKSSEKLQGLKDKTGKDYTKFYEDLSPEEQILFAQLDINKYQSEKAIMAELHRLQNIINQEEIQVRLAAITNAQDILKENGMSADDWNNLRENTLNWGKDGIIEFSEFLKMTYDEQQQYLTDMQLSEQSALLGSTKNTIAQLQSDLQTIQKEIGQGYHGIGSYQEYLNQQEQYRIEAEALQNEINENDLALQNKIIAQNIYDQLSNVNNLNEFDNILIKAKTIIQDGEILWNLYSEGLIKIAKNYKNCTDEIKAYEEALQSGTIAEIESAEQALKLAISIGEAAEKYKLNAEEIKVQAAQLMIAYGLSEAAAAKLAIENHRMNEGVSKLSENWSKWKEELSKSDKTTTDYAKTVVELTQTIAKLVGASEDLELPQEFLNSSKTLELIEKAAEGDINAINELGVAVAAETVKMIELNAAITRTLEDDTIKSISLEDFKTAKDTVMQGIQDLQTQIANGSIAVGDSIGSMGTTWAESLNKMAMATGMSVEEMNSLLSSMGVDAEVVVDYVKQTTKVPVYETITSEPEPFGEGGQTRQTSYTNIIGYEEVTGVVPVAQINMGEDKKSPNITYIGNGNVSSSSTGGGKTSKAPEKIKKSDMTKRYKEIDESLEETSDAMKDASKAANRLYGSSRIKQMQKVNNELKKEIGLLELKKKEAEGYLKDDEQALKDAVEDANDLFGTELELKFDTDGSVANYTAIMNSLIDLYNAKIDEYGEEITEQQKKQLEELKDRIDAFQKAIDRYDETRSTIRDIDNRRQDAFNEWQDNNYEQLSYKLEIDLEINEAELRDLEYRINRLGDTAAEMAEAISLIYSSTGGSQYDFYDKAIKRYASQRDTLDTAYRSGRISQADYVEGLREVSDGIYENLEALNDLDKTMMEYYGNTLAAANEELDKFIECMSHSAGILEHYSSIMDLLGKSSDYKTMGVILEGQADVAENQAKSFKAIMEMMQGEAEDRYRAYQDALASGDKAAAELYLKQYEEALAAAQEAEDEYLSNAEQWAESLKAILENKLADLGKTLEEALTGGTSFEQLTTQMERAASLQEEYLTSTNQIYETTKMMRAAQQEIDKTTNTVAKNKIANFIAETKQLQNQSKLSQYELDVQQAKYDLLLAEIALQEAQNAKSTVRLQRDAEGNFGYVYTADSSAIADATQKYEDAQNALYNIGLKGANDYGQKYQQTMNEMYDSLTELQNQYLSGAFESESAYNLAVEEAKRYYYTKLEQYSSLYATATMTDSRVVAEAWFNDFSGMMTTSETWKLAVEEHVANVSIAFGEWQSQVEAIASDAGIGGDLESLKLKVNGIVLETNNLTDELTRQGGTIDSLQGSLDTVKKSTDAYAELREQLQLAAERYREVAQAASEAAATEALIDRSNEQIKDFGEQADECIRKIESTYAEMEEKLKEVKEKYLRGEIDENQYNEQVDAIKNQYYEELKKLSQEYREILAKDNDLVAEDWFLTLEEMLKNKETFNQSVEEYLKEVEEYFKNMGQTTQDVATETGGILKTFTADVGGVKEAIDLLNKSIVDSDGLVSAFEEQDEAIENSCGLYGDLDTKLRTVIQTYEALAAAARDAAHAQSSVSGGGGGGSSYSGIDMHIPRSEFSYAHFDTGGYTGQWGSYGKLAMLHEKELVLNKGDTENFLASMGILNNILQTIDLQSANAQIGGILTTPNFHGGGNDMLEQNVHIEASFPNVQNSNDIEEAFNNLINRASQYANRK